MTFPGCEPMSTHRILTLGPDSEPKWVRLYVQPVGQEWAAMIVADDVEPPVPVELKGRSFSGNTPAEAKELAPRYLGLSEPMNRRPDPVAKLALSYLMTREGFAPY